LRRSDERKIIEISFGGGTTFMYVIVNNCEYFRNFLAVKTHMFSWVHDIAITD